MRTCGLFLGLVLLSSCTGAGGNASSDPAENSKSAPKRPIGIYAGIGLGTVVGEMLKVSPSPSPAQVLSQLKDLYDEVIADPGVSGIWLGPDWNQLNPDEPVNFVPSDPGYHWEWVDAAFDSVIAYNAAYGTHKTIAISVSPGVYAPDWLLVPGPDHPDALTSCDGLFDDTLPSPGPNCDTVTIPWYPEIRAVNPRHILPLPWSKNYQDAWGSFLGVFAQQYQHNANPDYRSILVGINIGGPTAGSCEMILPDTNRVMDGPGTGSQQVSPHQMWIRLLKNFAGSTSALPFVDAWNTAVTQYNQAFTGITLIMAPDDGHLNPDFPMPSPLPSPYDYPEYATLASTECPDGDLSCLQVTNILASFLLTSGHNNRLATAEEGLIAANPTSFDTSGHGDIGVPGIKLLASPSPWPQILGGAQLDLALTSGYVDLDESSYSGMQQDGCPTWDNSMSMLCPLPPAPGGLTPELALLRAMNVLFFDTPAGDVIYDASTSGPTNSAARVTWLRISHLDIKYAQAAAAPQPSTQLPVCNPVPLSAKLNPTGQPVTLEYLLALANWQLAQPRMGNSLYPPPQPVLPDCTHPHLCGGCPTDYHCEPARGECVPDPLCPGPECPPGS